MRTLEEGMLAAAIAVGSVKDSASSYPLALDTAIMDEAACVLETAIPVVLALGVRNLVLVGVRAQIKLSSLDYFVSLA